jgi:hypothetical protein
MCPPTVAITGQTHRSAPTLSFLVVGREDHVLLVAQCGEGINPRSAAGGEEAGCGRDGDE